MTALDIELLNFALVNLGCLGQEVHRELLLKERITLVLFVGEDALYRIGPPVGFAGWRWNPTLGQLTWGYI